MYQILNITICITYPSFSKFNKLQMDISSVLLAQLTDLQRRITNQDATISALKAEVERIGGNRISGASASFSLQPPPLRTGPGPSPVPLKRGMRDSYEPPNRIYGDKPHIRDTSKYDKRERTDNHNKRDTTFKESISLSSILTNGEEVTFQASINNEESGIQKASCIAVFSDNNFTVKSCEVMNSFVGQKFDKPGALLYKFIASLHDEGHSKWKSSSVAPWKWCSVVRDGKQITLEDLRKA